MSAPKEERSAGDFWANAVGIFLLVIAALGFIGTHWPFFVVLFALVTAAIAAYLYFASNSYHVKTAWQNGKKDYDDLYAQYKTLTPCPPDKIRMIIEQVLVADGIDISQPSATWFIDTVTDMYRRDYRGGPFPEYPSLQQTRDTLHVAAVLDDARKIVDYAAHEGTRADLTMDLVKRLVAAPWDFAGTQPNTGPLAVHLFEAVPDIRDMVTSMSSLFFLSEYWDLGVGEWLREKYFLNLYNASLKTKTEDEIRQSGKVVPDEFEGTAQEVVEAYLGGTPFLQLFAQTVAWPIPEKLRPEHGVIIAGSGGGKTQLLESLILADLEDAARPGVILIDSKGEMIERIAHLACFHPDHGSLRDQLIIIDHKDKPALNMFDMDEELVSTKINEVASLMRYFFGGLFGSQLSDQMDVLFLPLLHMIMRMPGATLHTFAELVGDPHQYPDVLARVPEGPRNFILNHYDDRGYAMTKSSIVTRLHRIINEVTLDEMFSAPNNAVDIGQALNDGKIILVSTDADGLQDLSPIFGKYFIAQVMNAGLSRGSRQRTTRRPIHFYIDECAPYVDDKLAQMLTTIRSYGIGVMMAFQGHWQMKTFTPVIVGNTAIKIMGTVDDDGDAKAFANSMRTEPEFIMAQRKRGGVGHFACYTRDLPRAISVALPFGQLDEREQMSDRDYGRVRALNRSRVATKPARGGASNNQARTTLDGAAANAPPVKSEAPGPKGRRPQQAGQDRSPSRTHRRIDPDAGARAEPSGDWEP